MSHKLYTRTTGTLFLVVGLVHLLRVLYRWEVEIGAYSLPMWVSWAAVAFLGYLSFTAFRRRSGK